MNPTLIRERLQDLPPDLPGTVGRFERVRDLVRRRRRRQVAGGAAAAVLVLAGIPLATYAISSTGDDRGVGPTDSSPSVTPSAAPLPGTDRETELSEPRTHEGNGTETVELGERPADATSVSAELNCLTPGRIVWPDGASLVCTAADVGSTTSTYVLELDEAQDEIVMSAKPGVGWRIRTTYLHVETTDWGVNENGDTYGATNDRGDPDLIAVVATNGKLGYVYRDDLEHASGGDFSTPAEALEWQEAHGDEEVSIPVYESDGSTVVGEFTMTPGSQPPGQ